MGNEQSFIPFVRACHQAEVLAKQEKQAFANFLLTQDDIREAFDFSSRIERGVGGLILTRKGQETQISFEFFTKHVVHVEVFCEIMVLAPTAEEPFRVKTQEEAVDFLRSRM